MATNFGLTFELYTEDQLSALKARWSEECQDLLTKLVALIRTSDGWHRTELYIMLYKKLMTADHVHLHSIKKVERDLRGAEISSVDLRGAFLREANLQGCNLNFADLRGANLSYADIQRAHCIYANFRGADLVGVNLQGAALLGANLRAAKLGIANLQEAQLWDAYMPNADLSGANLQGANLLFANLQGAKLRNANLQGAKLSCADLQGVDAKQAIVDGKTLLDEHTKIDKDTDFSSVGLDNARIEEQKKSQLKRNIREIHWKKRYKQNPFLNVVRPFWWASDYGSSTAKLIFSFFLVSLLFAFLYLTSTIPAPKTPLLYFAWGNWSCTIEWPTYDHPFVDGLVQDEILPNGDKRPEKLNAARYLRAYYFSVATMTTLGFGDIKAHPKSLMGLGLVTFQVLSG